MQPIREENLSVVERKHQVSNQAWHRKWPTLYFNRIDLNYFVDFPLIVLRMEMPHGTAQCRIHVAVATVWIMVKPHLQCDHPRLAQVHRLLDRVLLPIPEMDLLAVLSCLNVFQVEAITNFFRCSPFATDRHRMTGLIPKIVVELHACCISIPATNNFKILVNQ